MTTILKPHFQQTQELDLAPYAMRSSESRGRKHPVQPDRYRNEFQRDRDRIIHCVAFRKLEYKTQVYVIHEGDYYRTRLTHTLEVAQIARTLARCLGLNPDLTEAIALCHDLGHTPFGHCGEGALDELLADQGGFEHNRQSLRVVDVLEERYHDIPGLNLTWEVREGIAKHGTEFNSPGTGEFQTDAAPTLEAQICDLADEIAYNHHDIDDAMKMGLLEIEHLKEVDWVWEIWKEQQARLPEGTRPKFVKYRTIGKMMDETIGDVLEHTRSMLEEHGVSSVEDVRNLKVRIADYSPGSRRRQEALKELLSEKVYRHPHVVRTHDKGKRFVIRLFKLYRESPGQLPLKYQARIESDGREQVITDYISGMTDNYCLEEYIKAFEPTLRRPS